MQPAYEHYICRPMHVLRLRLLILFCGPALLFAQPVHNAYTLRYQEEIQRINGKLEVRFQNQQTKALDTLYLHLPARALQWEGSALHHQLLEYQKVEAHFADTAARGGYRLSNIEVDEQSFGVCTACEFVALPLATPLVPGDSVLIRLPFTLFLPEASFTGIGYRKDKSVRLAGWLPKMATLRHNRWHLYPYRLQSDVYPQSTPFSVELSLPADLVVLSNLALQDSSEWQWLKQGAQAPQAAAHSKTLHFKGRDVEAQLFWSRHYLTRVLPGSRLFATEDEDYAWAAVWPLISPKIEAYFLKEGLDTPASHHLLLLDNKKAEYQNSGGLAILQSPKDAFDFETELLYALSQQKLRYAIPVNGITEAWIARGLPYFYKYHYIQTQYPKKEWLPFSFSFLGRFFDLDEFDNSYQNVFLYLYLARQNLDQAMHTPIDSLTRLNYEAIVEAKSFLLFNHLRAYTGERSFKRAVHRYRQYFTDSLPAADQLQEAFRFYHNQPVAAFFNALPRTTGHYEFALTHTDYCPTVATATVINRGEVDLPYSLTGYRDGKPLHTEWFQPHTGTKTVQLIHEKYDYVVLNAHFSHPEFSQKNNRVNRSGLFKQMEPLRLQFYNSFERPDRTQVFWLPTVGYNAYDRLLLGVTLSNSSLVQKPFEYAIGPEFSTGTGRLTGYGSLVYNHLPKAKSSLLRQWTAGLFTRYYHYDEDLSYFRLSPALNFYLEDPHAYRKIRQRIRLRGVRVDRELPPGFDGENSSLGTASYSVFNANYKLENISIIKPYTLRADFQLGDQFSRMDLEADLRWMLPNKKWLIWRNFGGLFFNAQFTDTEAPTYYSYGLSGTQDYLFDYTLIGRSDQTGIWSRQFFTTDGGFKSETGVFADEFILSSNLSVPLYSFFGVFGDVGVADNFKQVYWDCGIRLAFLTDFVEVYFPLANHQSNFIAAPNFFSNTRFVLDFSLGNIIARIRRGYY